jgi:hypothetical protein
VDGKANNQDYQKTHDGCTEYKEVASLLGYSSHLWSPGLFDYQYHWMQGYQWALLSLILRSIFAITSHGLTGG